MILADGVAAEHLPQVLTSSKSTVDRAQLYLEGGCFFVTSRILILDLLQKRVQPECITGLVVLDAHRVTSNSVEAFILRLYRAKNSTGFVKAFSDNAESLAGGFAKLTKVMEHNKKWSRQGIVAGVLESKSDDQNAICVKICSTSKETEQEKGLVRK